MSLKVHIGRELFIELVRWIQVKEKRLERPGLLRKDADVLNQFSLVAGRDGRGTAFIGASAGRGDVEGATFSFTTNESVRPVCRQHHCQFH